MEQHGALETLQPLSSALQGGLVPPRPGGLPVCVCLCMCVYVMEALESVLFFREK